MSDISLRVFRRNNKKLIILWDKDSLPHDDYTELQIFLVDEKGKIPLHYQEFISHDTEKFQENITGVIISHQENDLPPDADLLLEFVFSSKSTNTFYKDQLKVTGKNVDSSSSRKLYGYNKESKNWYPLNCDLVDGKYVLLVKLVK